MISPVRLNQTSSTPSTIAGARARTRLYPPRPRHVHPRSLTQAMALERDESPPNPLWIVAVSMAVFLAALALLILRG